jgi:hypothetical protein
MPEGAGVVPGSRFPFLFCIQQIVIEVFGNLIDIRPGFGSLLILGLSEKKSKEGSDCGNNAAHKSTTSSERNLTRIDHRFSCGEK